MRGKIAGHRPSIHEHPSRRWVAGDSNISWHSVSMNLNSPLIPEPVRIPLPPKRG
jgi:hypothetical protein